MIARTMKEIGHFGGQGMAKKKSNTGAATGGVLVVVLAGLKLLPEFGKWLPQVPLTTGRNSGLLIALVAAVAIVGGLIWLLRHQIRPKRLREQTSVDVQAQVGYLAPAVTRQARRSKLWLVALLWGAALVIAIGYAMLTIL